MKKAYLVLEDGSVYPGRALGATKIGTGEIVFHTGMTGYQEVLTDPSYCGQIVMMTYPHIGSTGVNPIDVESRNLFLSGFVMGHYVDAYSNHRATRSLQSYLQEYNIPAIDQIDTREITRKIRSQGSMRALLSTSLDEVDQLKKILEDTPSMEGLNLVREVTSSEPYTWNKDLDEAPQDGKKHLVVIDCGVKYNILRHFVSLGYRITVVPAHTKHKDILDLQPDGIMVSNGPGDPAMVEDVIETLKYLMGQLPIMGICLGHQLLALALGAKTYKLKFGHHGSNHPVKNLLNGKIEITSMNHGFAVDAKSLQQLESALGKVELTHIHLSDDTLEGFRIPSKNIFAIQYHPESSPGPHDANYLMKEFDLCIEKCIKKL